MDMAIPTPMFPKTEKLEAFCATHNNTYEQLFAVESMPLKFFREGILPDLVLTQENS